MRKPAKDLSRSELLALLAAFVAQRPGIEPGNYHTYASYRAESREVTRDRNHFDSLLSAVSWREGITADAIRAALQSGGRLTLSDDGRLDYCTGQYFPTEYRKAVCRVLAGLLWDYWRENAQPLTPSPEGRRVSGDDIRRCARRELSPAIARRYFN